MILYDGDVVKDEICFKIVNLLDYLVKKWDCYLYIDYISRMCKVKMTKIVVGRHNKLSGKIVSGFAYEEWKQIHICRQTWPKGMLSQH